MNMRKYPQYICHSCGTSFCRDKAGSAVATFHLNDCDCCGAVNVPCTEPRDYGGFSQWPLPREIDPNPGPSGFSDLIELNMQKFDFERVHKVMTVTNWQWARGDGPNSVPTIEQLKATARRLLTSVVAVEIEKDSWYGMATGGFEVRKWESSDESDEDSLELKFVVESTCYCIEDLK